ncbi:hypothetical protein K3H85_25585, partial [Klebsiella pneumoniae]|nr:hypothetical protein [Klebsiella pneumoniae]
SYFSAYLTLWFPLLIWWTPLCRMLQIMTRRFTLYAYKEARKVGSGIRAGRGKVEYGPHIPTLLKQAEGGELD